MALLAMREIFSERLGGDPVVRELLVEHLEMLARDGAIRDCPARGGCRGQRRTMSAPTEASPSRPDRPPVTPQLAESGVVAILRGDRDAHLDAVAMALVEGGITCLELTLTTPGALVALARLRQRSDTVAFGMGSVTTADQARSALDAGADFLVSPAVCPEVVEQAVRAHVACYPGAWTPSEILAAWSSGASAVKLFPAGVRRTPPLNEHPRAAARHPAGPDRRGRAGGRHGLRGRRGLGGRARQPADRRRARRWLAAVPGRRAAAALDAVAAGRGRR